MSSNFTFTDSQIMSDADLVVAIFRKAQVEIVEAIKSKNLWRDADRHQMMQQIRRILGKAQSKSGSEMNSLIEDYYRSGTAEVDEAVGKRGVFQLIDKSAVEFIVASLPEIQAEFKSEVATLVNGAYVNIERSLNLVKKSVRAELLSEVGVGQITGKSRNRISQRLIEKLEEEGVTGFEYSSPKSGTRKLSTEAYAKALARSTLITARASSTIQRAIELGEDLVRVSTHSDPSPMCRKWAGQILSITGQSKDYKPLNEAIFKGSYKQGGIFHRFCRHSLNVYIPTK